MGHDSPTEVITPDCEHTLNSKLEFLQVPCCPTADNIWTGGEFRIVTPQTFTQGVSSGWYPLNKTTYEYIDVGQGFPAGPNRTYPDTQQGGPYHAQYYRCREWTAKGPHPSEILSLEKFRMLNHSPWIRYDYLLLPTCEDTIAFNRPYWQPTGHGIVLDTYPEDVSIYETDLNGVGTYSYSSSPGPGGLPQSELGFKWRINISPECTMNVTVHNYENDPNIAWPIYRYQAAYTEWYSLTDDGANPLPRQIRTFGGDPEWGPEFTHSGSLNVFPNRLYTPNPDTEFSVTWTGVINPASRYVTLIKNPDLTTGRDPEYGDKLILEYN